MPERNVARKALFWVWLAILTWLSLKATGNSNSWLHQAIPHADKVMHLGAYAVTTLIGCVSFGHEEDDSRMIWIVALGCFSWSVLMEVIQLLLATGRHFEFLDIIANIIGCFVGVAAYRFIKQKKLWK